MATILEDSERLLLVLLAMKEDNYWQILYMFKLCLNCVTSSNKNIGKLSLSVWLLSDNAQFTITSHLYKKRFATVDFVNWTTLPVPTVPIWLPVTIICTEIRNLIFVEPGLQMMNRWKLLLKRGLKGRTENSFFKAQTVYQKNDTIALMLEETISKNGSTIGSLWLFSISKLQNVLDYSGITKNTTITLTYN